jgi:type II secretory pathway pseudopilin PulG
MTLIEVVVALAITGLTVAGIVSGYIYCNTANVRDALYMAANGRAQERLEETRAARWDTSSFPSVDQLIATNFPDVLVTLDKAASNSTAITATLKTDISLISTSPPLKRIRVDCIWVFNGAESITNTIETCRAPDQ